MFYTTVIATNRLFFKGFFKTMENHDNYFFLSKSPYTILVGGYNKSIKNSTDGI